MGKCNLFINQIIRRHRTGIFIRHTTKSIKLQERFRTRQTLTKLVMAKYNVEDYLFWDDDDLDLDQLLGEYTEDDNDEAKNPQESFTVYVCPVCRKDYKTISGFRGHVLKKHKQNLRGISDIFCN